MIKIGVIGFGYWGPNIVRNLVCLQGAQVIHICDLDDEARKKAKDMYPHINVISDYNEILTSDVDAIAIVTPVSSHYPLAKEALENEKHVFVEKPFTASSKEARELIEIAEKNNCKIMIDHTFIFTGAVRKIKELMDQNILGEPYYYDSSRVSLGIFQHDTNVIWDLAAHDFAIMDFCLNNKPIAVSAQGADHMKTGQANIAYITIYFENNLIGHINVNWLSPVKIRTTVIGCEKQMLVWDDLQNDEKIRIYDKGVKVDDREGIYRLRVDYRSGDMHSPRIDHEEALKRELQHFIDCIENNETPMSDGYAGLRVVQMLEAADQSLKNSGELVQLTQLKNVRIPEHA